MQRDAKRIVDAGLGGIPDEAYRALQRELLRNPGHGNVIPRTGGFRELRWEDQRRGKGRRSGLRIIYYVLASARQIWFFSIYAKNEADDLTAEQCRRLRSAIQQELRARRGLP